MICGSIHADVIGAFLVTLGLLALLYGFFRGLANLKEREGIALLVFTLGIAGVAVGAWLIRAC
ncbi:hypothetical protein [Aestuariivirga sp.]|uniref:hypothetical protein n=1 Tax=Aestuariivirga sp. TaxID=2650926 RepID=UPI003919D435